MNHVIGFCAPANKQLRSRPRKLDDALRYLALRLVGSTMECIGQIEANRRNARNSTVPTTEEGKQRSRCSRDTRVQSREHSGILRGRLLQQPGHAQMMRGRYLMNDAAGDLKSRGKPDVA